MKNTLFCLVLTISFFSQAQNVGVNVQDINSEEGTTIEIKKGTKSSGSIGTLVTAPLYQITEGDEVIEGDGAPLLKEARSNWKKACSEWKKEFKDMNKDNKILTMNCGKQECATAAMETVCSSKATYKLKVKMN
ncbi:MAG: hypothetical protein ACK5V3_16200 [Bdellovibrionales bacterium]